MLTIRFLLIFVLCTLFAAEFAVAAPDCSDFSKGDYSGGVSSKDECRTACEKAEGFCCGDFKSAEYDETETTGSGNETATVTVTMTAARCECTNSNDGSGERRLLCEDSEYVGGAARPSAFGLLAATALAAIWLGRP